MFDKYNPYSLHTETIEGITRYFVSFADGEKIHREIEVSRPVYLAFLRFAKDERNLRRSDERHIEPDDLTDETLYERAFSQPKSVEAEIIDKIRNERLRLAIGNLPEIQRRRFVLHYELGLSYEQIAQIEGCKKVAIKYSIDRAKEKIKIFLKNF